MEIKTFGELIEWTRQLHAQLARCFSQCATKHEDERARELLDYLATHESEIERIVTEFERQGDNKALETRTYDYLSNAPIKSYQPSEESYVSLDFDGICRELFEIHDQIIELYRTLIEKAEIPEAKEMFESLLSMEQNESMRLARQVGQTQDL